jgi:hypothetical protein
MTYKTAEEIEQGMGAVFAAPRDAGQVRLIVRRPARGEREIVEEAELDLELGLVGDDWVNRAGLRSDGPNRFAQLTLMNAGYAELIAGPRSEDWAPAGDQMYLDLDISKSNLPPGARISVGEAVVEISAEPHTGCAQFSARFGSEALKATNTERGRELRLRGANAMVVKPGVVRTGDQARKT